MDSDSGIGLILPGLNSIVEVTYGRALAQALYLLFADWHSESFSSVPTQSLQRFPFSAIKSGNRFRSESTPMARQGRAH